MRQVPNLDAKTMIKYLAAQYAWCRKASDTVWAKGEKYSRQSEHGLADFYQNQSTKYFRQAEVYRSLIMDIRDGRPQTRVALADPRRKMGQEG